MNKDNDTRVLGRVLAVEETRAVAGAAKTTACIDFLTSSTVDTTRGPCSDVPPTGPGGGVPPQ